MRKAFTLIELLIVVAIIAILAAIAVPNFLEAQTRAKVSRAKADMRSLATALETYTVDNNKPMTIVQLGKIQGTAGAWNGPSIINSSFTSQNCVSGRFKRLTTPISYMSSVVPDPFRPTGYGTDAGGGVNVDYDTFDYWSAYDFGPGGSYDTGTLWRGAGITSGAAWRLVSAGPDKVNFFGGGYVNQHTIDRASYGVDYDPTNGTVSRGDVVRVASAPGPIHPSRLPAIDRIQNKYNQTGL